MGKAIAILFILILIVIGAIISVLIIGLDNSKTIAEDIVNSIVAKNMSDLNNVRKKVSVYLKDISYIKTEENITQQLIEKLNNTPYNVSITVINKSNITQYNITITEPNKNHYNVTIINESNFTVKVPFEDYLASQQMVKDLPVSSKIILKLFNDSAGERKVDNEYVITKNVVIEGTVANPDIVILINSKYLDDMKNGFCETIKNARDNNDAEIELKITETQLMLRYSGMMKYKDCLM